MGYWSERALELQDPDRLGSDPEYFICSRCIADPALQRLIAKNVQKYICSSCGRRTRTRLSAAPLDLVVRRIFEGLSRRYEDAANGLAYDGGYVGDHWDTIDLVQDSVDLGAEADADLLYKIAELLPDRIWSEVDPYGPREADVLLWTWDAFAHRVKHQRRFFFLDETGGRQNEERLPAGEWLAQIAEGCIDYGLITDLPKGYRLFRCRSRKRMARITEPKDLGPPPPDSASQSRMSAAGIPMFYGAEDKRTALAETVAKGRLYAMGDFRTTRPLRVLDLTDLPSVSMFDAERWHLYDWASFMGGFIEDFRKPIEKDGREHINYVPTQVVTEYFRSVVKIGGGTVDGVRYRSSRRQGGICCVLFATAEDVVPPKGDPNDTKYMVRLRKVVNAGPY